MILLVVVITKSIVEEELSGPGVDSPPSSIGDREPSSDDDHVELFAVVDVAIPIDDLEHLGLRITLKSTKVLVHVLSVGKSTVQGESNHLYGGLGKGAKTRVRVFADIQNFALRAWHSLGVSNVEERTVNHVNPLSSIAPEG